MKTLATKPRSLKTARKLTCYLPGLGHLYCGDFKKAILLMFGSAIAIALCIVAWALDPPRTIHYLILLLLVHIAMGIWSYLDIKKTVLRTREDYRLKDYNRPWIYALFFFTYTLCTVPIAVFSLKAFVSNPYKIAGHKGAPNTAKDDYVLASKIAYRTASPQTGDLIVFRESFTGGRHLIRRIVAKEGDTFEIKNNQILINGSHENADYKTVQTAPLEDFKKITLASSELFVLSDNRDVSDDSRSFGPISVFSVEGKVNFRIWPLNKIGSLD